MNIVYIGNVEFSKVVLKRLIELQVNISGVITMRTSRYNTDYADLSPLCNKNGIDILHCVNINSEDSITWIKNKEPDYVFCFGWSQILKSELLKVPRFGVIGFHPADLPYNRGRHPIIWALCLGLTKTSSTFFMMDEGADSGDIISKSEIIIEYKDTSRILYDKIITIALSQIENMITELESHTIIRNKQDHSLANYWRKRTEEDGKIDFRMSSRAIYNLIRSLTRPYPGAHVVFHGKIVKIWQAEEVHLDLPNIEYGKVIDVDGNRITIKCYDNGIVLTAHEFTEYPEVGDYLL
jgi:methionyl-tRNA formyltransferase